MPRLLNPVFILKAALELGMGAGQQGRVSWWDV